jgi:glutaredoxin 2
LSNVVQPRCCCEWCVGLNCCSLVAATLLYVDRNYSSNCLGRNNVPLLKKEINSILAVFYGSTSSIHM